MTTFRDGLIGPTVILLSICFVMTLALAFTYQTTEPIIAQAEIEAANVVRGQVLPGNESFEKMDIDLPDGVFEVYKAEGGYVFKTGAKGFDGIVTYMIGMDNDGNVVGIDMFDSNETPGLGTKIAHPDYIGKYLGKTNPDSVDAITGATKTSNSLKNSLKQAQAAFELVKGA